MSIKNTEKTSRKNQGFISTTIASMIHLIIILLMAWILLGVIFCMIYIHSGANAVYSKIHAIAQENEGLLSTRPFIQIGNQAYPLFEEAFQQGQEWLSQTIHVQAGMDHVIKTQQTWVSRMSNKSIPHQNLNALAKKFQAGFKIIQQILTGTTLIILQRTLIFLLAIPLFLLCFGLGIIDGLVQRDIRKFQGARESTLLFHEIKRSLGWVFFIPLLVYFSLPWPVSPVWFLVPIAITVGVLTELSVRSFKKYT